MKTITNRLQCSLSEATVQLLNQQVAIEGQSSAHYLAMASWCHTQGYKDSAAFLYHHAEEEKGHMLKLFHYINDAGGHAKHPEITGITHTFTSFREVFTLALRQEIRVTEAIHQLVHHCLSSKDFATFNFLQWYVAEQIEEEGLLRRTIELFDLIGEEGIGRYTIDKAIGALQSGA